ncbi:MAG: hypothetical protein ACYTDT_05240 [Planctomycetota bacterium]|jgi:peptidoglycan hydrolase CwlO-like protein
MGVFSRTMLMLTIVWLASLIVIFMTKSTSGEADWRDKFVAEANIRRAIAYRYVDLRGGMVAHRGITKTDTADGREKFAAKRESLGLGPYTFDGGVATGFSGGGELPGSLISADKSLISKEKAEGRVQVDKIKADRLNVEGEITDLHQKIEEALRRRQAADAKFAEVRENIRLFAAEMDSYRYIIASFQAKAFNLDYEIQRIMVERDALTAELAQINNDIARIGKQQVGLEDAYYGISKHYEKTIKILAWYEQADPKLRELAVRTGASWLRGQVVGVGSDPRTGVVSISLGENEGVKEGQSFSIFRNDKFIARMVVENVRANVAVGRVLPEFRGKVAVMANDSVKVSEPLKRNR